MLVAIAAIAFTFSLTSCDKLGLSQKEKAAPTATATKSEATNESSDETVTDNSAEERIARAKARTAEAEAAEAEAKAAEAEARAEAAKKSAEQAQRAPREVVPPPSSGRRSGSYDPSSRYDWLSYRLATYDDIRGMSRYEIKVMKNSIYARHHYAFQTTAMINHFSRKSWYDGYLSMSDAAASFNSTESKNVQFLKRYE